MTTRLRLSATAVLISCAAFSSSCTDKPEPAWPSDTVFVLDDQPIRESEIDAIAEPLIQIGPSYTLPHRRRKALTEVLIPRARARALHPEARAAAESRIAGRSAAIESGTEALPTVVIGNWATIGLLTWVELQACPVGEWTPVFEGPGTFAQAKLLARDENPIATLEVFECLLIWEEYSAEFSTDPAVFGGKLEVVADDRESWSAVLPTSWLFELEGSKR